MAFYEGASVVWQVFGHRDDQRVSARAPSQKDAWRFAAIQIVKVRGAAFLERLMAIEREIQEAELDDERLLEESDAIEFELGRDEIFQQDWLT